MASEQSTHSDATTPPIFVHPPSPAPAEPIDITDVDDYIPEDEDDRFKPHLQHLDRVGPEFGVRPELAFSHLPPMPSRCRRDLSRSSNPDPSRLQASNIPSSQAWMLLEGVAAPRSLSAPRESVFDRNWDPVVMASEVFGNEYYYYDAGLQFINPFYNGPDQGERRN